MTLDVVHHVPSRRRGPVVAVTVLIASVVLIASFILVGGPPPSPSPAILGQSASEAEASPLRQSAITARLESRADDGYRSIIVYSQFRRSVGELIEQLGVERDVASQSPQNVFEDLRPLILPTSPRPLRISLGDLREGHTHQNGVLVALVEELGFLPRSFHHFAPLTASRRFTYRSGSWLDLRVGLPYNARTGCSRPLPAWATQHEDVQADCLPALRSEFDRRGIAARGDR